MFPISTLPKSQSLPFIFATSTFETICVAEKFGDTHSVHTLLGYPIVISSVHRQAV